MNTKREYRVTGHMDGGSECNSGKFLQTREHAWAYAVGCMSAYGQPYHTIRIHGGGRGLACQLWRQDDGTYFDSVSLRRYSASGQRLADLGPSELVREPSEAEADVLRHLGVTWTVRAA